MGRKEARLGEARETASERGQGACCSCSSAFANSVPEVTVQVGVLSGI